MKYCPRCGMAVEEGHQFCRRCGLKQTDYWQEQSENIPSQEPQENTETKTDCSDCAEQPENQSEIHHQGENSAASSWNGANYNGGPAGTYGPGQWANGPSQPTQWIPGDPGQSGYWTSEGFVPRNPPAGANYESWARYSQQPPQYSQQPPQYSQQPPQYSQQPPQYSQQPPQYSQQPPQYSQQPPQYSQQPPQYSQQPPQYSQYPPQYQQNPQNQENSIGIAIKIMAVVGLILSIFIPVLSMAVAIGAMVLNYNSNCKDDTAWAMTVAVITVLVAFASMLFQW